MKATPLRRRQLRGRTPAAAVAVLLLAGCSHTLEPGNPPAKDIEAQGDTQAPLDARSYPPAVFTPLPFDSLGGFHYHYLDGWMAGQNLHLQLGYSGCQPEHPFTLYWQPGDEGSPLPHAHLYLAHELNEDCLAYFERELGFDLHPIWIGMGSPLIPVQLRFLDFQGDVHAFELSPPVTGVP